MVNCEDCAWFSSCKHCNEYGCSNYVPWYEEEKIQAIEYEKNLKERVDSYQEIINEFND